MFKHFRVAHHRLHFPGFYAGLFILNAFTAEPRLRIFCEHQVCHAERNCPLYERISHQAALVEWTVPFRMTNVECTCYAQPRLGGRAVEYERLVPQDVYSTASRLAKRALPCPPDSIRGYSHSTALRLLNYPKKYFECSLTQTCQKF